MAAKKKTASAADFRKKEEADKKKMAEAAKNRTDAKGRSGFGADDGFRTPQAGSVGGNLHNELRSIVVGGPIIKAATGKIAGVVGQRVSTVVEEAAWNAASKGLGASGAGGKVKNVMTPMGKTLGSTNIGSAAQQAARMNNLAANAEKIAYSTSAEVARKAIRGINSAGKIVRVGAAGALLASNVAPKKKKK